MEYETPFGTVSVLEQGTGDETLIMFHAAGASAAALRPLAEGLANAHRRVVAVDLHAYGASVHRGANHASQALNTLDKHLDIARWVITTFGTPHMALFGHSMGGLVALLSAGHCAPDTDVVLYEPIVLDALNLADAQDLAALDWDRAIVDPLIAAADEGDARGALPNFVSAWNQSPWENIPRPVRERLLDSANAIAKEAQAVSYANVDFDTLQARAERITIFYGEQSLEITHRIAVRLHQRLAGATLNRIPGGTHMLPIIGAGAFAKTLDAIITQRAR